MRASKASLSPPAPASSAAVSEGRVFLPAASVPARSEHVRARTLPSVRPGKDLSVSVRPARHLSVPATALVVMAETQTPSPGPEPADPSSSPTLYFYSPLSARPVLFFSTSTVGRGESFFIICLEWGISLGSGKSPLTPTPKSACPGVGVGRLRSTSYHWSSISIFCLKFSPQFKTDLIYFLPTLLIFPELSKLYFTPLLTGVPARWRTFASSSV